MVKQCLMYSVDFCPIQCSLVLSGSTQSTSVHSVHFGLSRSPLVLFGPLRSNSVHSVYYFPIWSYSVLVDPIQSILFTLVLCGLFSIGQSTSILLSPLWSTSAHMVYISLIQSNLVHWSTLFNSVLFGPWWGNLVYSGSIQSTLVYSVYLVHICPIWFILSTSVHLV